MSNIDNVKTGVYTYRGKDYTFNYFTDISVQKKINFIGEVTDAIITEQHYYPVLKSLIFGFRLISIFSDALSNWDKEDKTFNLTEIEDIVTNTKIVDIIIANAKVGLIDELQESVNKDIEYKTGIHENPVGEAVAGFLGTLEQRVKDIDIDGLMGFAKVFKDIPAEEMTSEKIWDSYSKSEAFKKVIESREKIDKIDKKQSDKIVGLAEEVVKQPKKRGRKPKAKKEGTIVEDKKVKDE